MSAAMVMALKNSFDMPNALTTAKPDIVSLYKPNKGEAVLEARRDDEMAGIWKRCWAYQFF